MKPKRITKQQRHRRELEKATRLVFGYLAREVGRIEHVEHKSFCKVAIASNDRGEWLVKAWVDGEEDIGNLWSIYRWHDKYGKEKHPWGSDIRSILRCHVTEYNKRRKGMKRLRFWSE